MNIELQINPSESFIEAENTHRKALSATDGPEEEKLVLYHYVGCPFCSIARSPIDRLETLDQSLIPLYSSEVAPVPHRSVWLGEGYVHYE
jgi:hypothetical protein